MLREKACTLYALKKVMSFKAYPDTMRSTLNLAYNYCFVFLLQSALVLFVVVVSCHSLLDECTECMSAGMSAQSACLWGRVHRHNRG